MCVIAYGNTVFWYMHHMPYIELLNIDWLYLRMAGIGGARLEKWKFLLHCIKAVKTLMAYIKTSIWWCINFVYILLTSVYIIHTETFMVD